MDASLLVKYNSPAINPPNTNLIMYNFVETVSDSAFIQLYDHYNLRDGRI